MKWVAWSLVGAALTACGSAPTTPPATAKAAAPAAAGPSTPPPEAAIAVALDVDVFGPDGGPPIAHVDRGEVLALDEDAPVRMYTIRNVQEVHAVRIRQADGSLLAGYVTHDEAAPRRGVGLYVTDDAPITDDDGHPLGTAHRGAFVVLREPGANETRIGLPPFERDGHIATSRLTRQPIALAPDPTSASTPHTFARLTLDDGTRTTCDEPLYVRGEDDAGAHVAETVAGIEMVGATKERGSSCPPHYLSTRGPTAGTDVAPPYVTVHEAPLALPTQGKALYLLERDEQTAEPSCRELRLSHGAKHHATTTYASEMFAFGKTFDTMTYELEGSPSLTRAPTSVLLEPSAIVTRDAKGRVLGRELNSAGGDVWSITVVGEDGRGLLVAPEVSSVTLRAYRPEDLTVWYRDRAQCQAIVVREHAALVKGPTYTARILAPRSSADE